MVNLSYFNISNKRKKKKIVPDLTTKDVVIRIFELYHNGSVVNPEEYYDKQISEL